MGKFGLFFATIQGVHGGCESSFGSATWDEPSPITGLNGTLCALAAVEIIGKLCQELGEKTKNGCRWLSKTVCGASHRPSRLQRVWTVLARCGLKRLLATEEESRLISSTEKEMVVAGY